ncbi:leukotoxin (plasmid) [Antarctobacter heliothermus]|uniref:Leukotoxin n=1 Tax=Antarctobacter heliothermus TaxID=74033 RepID=A0A222EBN5_9RHOB|nr:calcium-binding protein [Antarctobacter heliothermus]ASP23606.1 leukotoxin [Antarctobacter heliothermus]
MASFILTGFSSIAQTLGSGETGVLTNADAELVVSGDAITTSGLSPNYIYVGGLVLANSTSAAHNAIDATGYRTEISVGPTGVLQALNGDTVSMQLTSNAYLMNAGTILSGEDAVDIRTADEATTTHISNSGLIQGQSDGVAADAGTSNFYLINTGTIIGKAGFGVFANWQSNSTGTSTLDNSGTIIGNAGSYTAFSGTGVDIINNAGLMVGDIYLDNNDDVYRGTSGEVQGTVHGDEDDDLLIGGEAVDLFDGGADNDTLIGHGGDDSLEGGSGDDFILGGADNDEINGGADNDTMNANAGDDTVYGEGGNDVLVGQDGSDLLDGGDNDDTMDGGNGDDTLEGGSGNDILRGRAGEDDLAGGLGLDYLTGGEGADNFVFRSIGDAGIGATRDQILDFEQGVDTIIIAGLSPGVFEFRGTAAFAPSANPEIRLNETATGSTIVQIDNNGDGTIDAEIRVGGVTGLTADDFVL